MVTPTIPPADYICRCGSVCTVERSHSWIFVTCNNPKCPEYGVRQLATRGIHTVRQKEASQ